MNALDPIESPVKLALDNAELIEHVPELQREATAVSYTENSDAVLILPRHPAVLAFIHELDTIEYATADLKTARRRLRIAKSEYQDRVVSREIVKSTSPLFPLFERHISLSAILMARAAAKHWHKVILKLETAEKLDRQQRWNDARKRVYAGRSPL
jgi:hypothetical protein